MGDRIILDPKVCHGRPVIRGTRTPVAMVIGALVGGMDFEGVQIEYGLSAEDVRAALRFASELLEHERHYPLPS